MWKKKERWTAAALLLAMVVVTGLCWYILYIRQQFYDEGTRNLLETYEQVDKAFTIFSRSNWNMLNEWGKSLQAANEEGLAEERLRSYEAEREIWRYSSVYLFNENCEYWSIRGKHEKVDHLWTAFEEMYRTGKPTVSSYIMRSGERRVVYSAPIAPVEIDGTTYTSLAVSYRNKNIEELIGGSAYGGQSDCYIIHPDGDVMLSEEPKSEIEDWMDNLFDYLQKYAQVDAGTLTRARQEEEARQQMEDLANTDGLTGLYNERYFDALLKENELNRTPFVLFYLDLDRFKPVNDRYGHDVGDQLLKEVASRLRGCVRESDAVFRIGGDEFALIVNGAITEGFCKSRVEKIKAAIREPYRLKDAEVQVGTSCGCAVYPSDRDDVRAIRILADHRMYEDKQRSGRSCE